MDMPDFKTEKERKAWQKRQQRLKHPTRDKEHREERWKAEPWKAFYNHVVSRCSSGGRYGKRGITCKLTIKGIKRLWFRDKAWLLERPSIDRIDNSKGYSYGNCQFIELIDNIKKGGK